MKAKIIFIVCILLYGLASGHIMASSLRFDISGFSIDALESEVSSTPYQVLAMFLPPTDLFAPNVNVQIQPFEGTLEEYVKLSKQQIDALGWSIVNVKISADGYATMEYYGELQGRIFRWYSRAKILDGAVYLVTATAIESQWPKVADQLIKCVESFRLN